MAESGNPVAQYAVALFFYWGDAIEIQNWVVRDEIRKLQIQNANESISWYKMAASQGHISAFRNLYVSTYNGKNGVQRDTHLALSYAESLRNVVKIPHSMCYTIANGYEDIKNYAMAIEWHQLAIAKGSLSSVNALGLLYLNGQGVQLDYAKAMELFSRGYQQQHSYSTYNLARCYHNGWGCISDQQTAFKLFTIAANQGVTNAQAFVAMYYDEGLGGVPVDYVQCRQWAEKAVSNGDSKSKYYIGKCYLYGLGVPVNYAVAMRNFQECTAKNKHAWANMCMAQMFENGLGVPVNYDCAVIYYQEAANCGYQPANAELARFKKSLLGKWKLV